MLLDDAVNTFVSGYFSTCKRSSKTRAAYESDLAQMKTYLGSIGLRDATPELLESWAAHLQAESYAVASIRRKFATAKVFFRYWVRKGIVDKSPLWLIRLDLGRERVLPRSLGPGDAKRFIEAVWNGVEFSDAKVQKPGELRFLQMRNIAAIETLFATGMRVGELVKLTLPDWREDERTFIVRGKGSRQRLAFLPDDRSLKAVRFYLAQRRGVDVGHDTIFLNASGGPLSTQSISRLVAETAKSAQVSRTVTPHMIRHTVATLLLRYGADIRVVQEVLGHASIATTQRYTHVSKEHLFSTLQARHPNLHLNVVAPALAHMD